MRKYDPLTRYLESQTVAEIIASFDDVERIIGAKLPRSAHVHDAWWENDENAHVQAKAWLAAGFRTERVDRARKRLVFRRVSAPPIAGESGVSESRREFKHDKEKQASARHPMIGAMKGWLTIDPDFDLTQPAMPEWADMLDEKYGPEKRR